jgi:quinoprotein glucose dehydrogenase
MSSEMRDRGPVDAPKHVTAARSVTLTLLSLIGSTLILSFVSTGPLRAQNAARGQWRYWGGDAGVTKYSGVDQITAANVKDLRIVWRRPAVDATLTKAFPDLTASPNLRGTPIMVDGVLYAPNGVGLLEAFDPATGKTIWVQQPFEPGMRGVAGQSTRGAAYWRSGAEERLFITRGEYLEAINPKTGKPAEGFGSGGRVNLHVTNSPWARNYAWTAAPAVVGDIVVLSGSNGNQDAGPEREAVPDNIRGFDARTGRLVWAFNVVPRPGEFGNDTWGSDSWSFAGNLNAWGGISVDESLGYVYVGLTAPNNSLYGGERPGQNLFANTLVCLDAKTGRRVWHYQLVHHDLWDYDLMTPHLGDITVDGRRIRAVFALSKRPDVFVFDRATGQPVWPIEERPVPQSKVPGEHSSPTQPFPTKPPAFDQFGMTQDDVIDFTPELRAQALALLKSYVLGPGFTPPSVSTGESGGTKGTFVIPGVGGTNFQGGTFDPETGILYVIAHKLPLIRGLIHPKALPAGSPNTSLPWGEQRMLVGFQALLPGSEAMPGPQGLPFTKPPYGSIVAIDMNRGAILWKVANGDGPRDHPALKALNLPPLGVAGRPTPLLTRTLLFLGEGSDSLAGVLGWGKKFRAYDKKTGAVVWETELPAGTTSGPITYLFNGKQYIVIPIGDKQSPPEWVALALP